MVAPVVLVTRPAPGGERLQQRLQQAGWDALWWPAFRIGPAPDAARVHATLARLADYELAVFVSPAAVRAVALWVPAWPAATRAGAVGEATAAELRAAIRLPAGALLAPPDDAAGSEAFWAVCQQFRLTPRRVLILRAQHGREWLAERFAAAGAQVDTLAVYARLEVEPDAAAQAALAAHIAQGRAAVTVVSSSEAVEALDRQVQPVAGAAGWLRAGVALATHARIAERLLAAGYTRVQSVDGSDDALLAQLESLASA